MDEEDNEMHYALRAIGYLIAGSCVGVSIIVIPFLIAKWFVADVEGAELNDDSRARYGQYEGYQDYRAYMDEFRSESPDVYRPLHIIESGVYSNSGTDMSMHYPEECREPSTTITECLQLWDDRDAYLRAQTIELGKEFE